MKPAKAREASRDKALEFYRKAADAKHKDAAYRLSFILLASEKEEEREQARKALETAAKEDTAVAGRILGEAYLRGRLTPTPDPDKAVFWWKSAGDAGDVPSVLLLASFYEGQFGFPELKNLKESMALYAKAAGLGNAGAMATLGSRLLNGDEIDPRREKGPRVDQEGHRGQGILPRISRSETSRKTSKRTSRPPLPNTNAARTPARWTACCAPPISTWKAAASKKTRSAESPY